MPTTNPRTGAVAIVIALLGLSCSSPSAKSHLVLVSQAASSSLAAVDPAVGRVVRRVTVGELPHRMVTTSDGRTAYVVLVGSQAVAEVDTATLVVRRTMLTAPVPAQRDDGSVIQEHADEHAFEETSCFACHHPAGAKPLVVGDRPVGIALSADESRLYLSHIRNARISVIELGSGALERTALLPVAGVAVQAADLALFGDTLAVTMRPKQPSTDKGVVRFLDAATLELVQDLPTGSDPASLVAAPDRGSVLVSNFETNTVTEFGPFAEPRTLRVTPGPLGTTLLDRGHALTLDYYSNSASIVDLGTGEAETFQLALNGHVFVNPTHAALSPDRRTAYVVSSGTDGHLLQLDLSTRKVVSAWAIDGLSFDAVVIPHEESFP